MIRNAATQAIEEAVQRERITKDWMDQKTTCEYLGISFGTLQNFRRLGLKISTVQGKTLVSKNEINRFLITSKNKKSRMGNAKKHHFRGNSRES